MKTLRIDCAAMAVFTLAMSVCGWSPAVAREVGPLQEQPYHVLPQPVPMPVYETPNGWAESEFAGGSVAFEPATWALVEYDENCGITRTGEIVNWEWTFQTTIEWNVNYLDDQGNVEETFDVAMTYVGQGLHWADIVVTDSQGITVATVQVFITEEALTTQPAGIIPCSEDGDGRDVSIVIGGVEVIVTGGAIAVAGIAALAGVVIAGGITGLTGPYNCSNWWQRFWHNC